MISCSGDDTSTVFALQLLGGFPSTMYLGSLMKISNQHTVLLLKDEIWYTGTVMAFASNWTFIWKQIFEFLYFEWGLRQCQGYIWRKMRQKVKCEKGFYPSKELQEPSVARQGEPAKPKYLSQSSCQIVLHAPLANNRHSLWAAKGPSGQLGMQDNLTWGHWHAIVDINPGSQQNKVIYQFADYFRKPDGLTSMDNFSVICLQYWNHQVLQSKSAMARSRMLCASSLCPDEKECIPGAHNSAMWARKLLADLIQRPRVAWTEIPSIESRDCTRYRFASAQRWSTPWIPPAHPLEQIGPWHHLRRSAPTRQSDLAALNDTWSRRWRGSFQYLQSIVAFIFWTTVQAVHGIIA